MAKWTMFLAISLACLAVGPAAAELSSKDLKTVSKRLDYELLYRLVELEESFYDEPEEEKCELMEKELRGALWETPLADISATALFDLVSDQIDATGLKAESGRMMAQLSSCLARAKEANQSESQANQVAPKQDSNAPVSGKSVAGADQVALDSEAPTESTPTNNDDNASYEPFEITLKRLDLSELSKVRQQMKQRPLNKRCLTFEKKLRSMLTDTPLAKLDTLSLFNRVAEVLKSRELPFGNKQPFLVALEECIEKTPELQATLEPEQSKATKRQVIAPPPPPAGSANNPNAELVNDQHPIRLAKDEFEKVKDNVKDFGLDLYQKKSLKKPDLTGAKTDPRNSEASTKNAPVKQSVEEQQLNNGADGSSNEQKNQGENTKGERTKAEGNLMDDSERTNDNEGDDGGLMIGGQKNYIHGNEDDFLLEEDRANNHEDSTAITGQNNPAKESEISAQNAPNELRRDISLPPRVNDKGRVGLSEAAAAGQKDTVLRPTSTEDNNETDGPAEEKSTSKVPSKQELMKSFVADELLDQQIEHEQDPQRKLQMRLDYERKQNKWLREQLSNGLAKEYELKKQISQLKTALEEAKAAATVTEPANRPPSSLVVQPSSMNRQQSANDPIKEARFNELKHIYDQSLARESELTRKLAEAVKRVAELESLVKPNIEASKLVPAEATRVAETENQVDANEATNAKRDLGAGDRQLKGAEKLAEKLSKSQAKLDKEQAKLDKKQAKLVQKEEQKLTKLASKQAKVEAEQEQPLADEQRVESNPVKLAKKLADQFNSVDDQEARCIKYYMLFTHRSHQYDKNVVDTIAKASLPLDGQFKHDPTFYNALGQFASLLSQSDDKRTRLISREVEQCANGGPLEVPTQKQTQQQPRKQQTSAAGPQSTSVHRVTTNNRQPSANGWQQVPVHRVGSSSYSDQQAGPSANWATARQPASTLGFGSNLMPQMPPMPPMPPMPQMPQMPQMHPMPRIAKFNHYN